MNVLFPKTSCLINSQLNNSAIVLNKLSSKGSMGQVNYVAVLSFISFTG